MSVHAAEIIKYADLVIRIGVNLQPGQNLFIRAETYPESITFVRHLVEKAYDSGARRVDVHWTDPVVAQLTIGRADREALQAPPEWLAKWQEKIAEGGGAFITVGSPAPDQLAGIDPARVAEARRGAAAAMSRVSRYTTSLKVSWCGVAVPCQPWADKVFPHLPAEDRLEQLWRHVLHAVRATADDPVRAWREHMGGLARRQAQLNSLRFKRLHYRAPGTELTIDLPENHCWISGGGSETPGGIPFVPNIPTEEVFTAPQRDGVNGVVRATLPLNYGGVLIKDLTLRLDQGRIVEYSASCGEESLKALVQLDEGSAYLGEVALVSVESPICQLGTLFHNTLYDENASCHLAIGRAYPVNIEGGGSMSPKELVERGVNWSLAHVDFMIGSTELDIDGETASGELVPVFRQGTWAV